MKYLHPTAGFVISFVTFDISRSFQSNNSKLQGTTNNKLKKWQSIWKNLMATPEILSTDRHFGLWPYTKVRQEKGTYKYNKYCWHKIIRHSAEMQWGQGHRQTCKQCLVQVICCISGRRVVHMTLRGTQKPGNYRNSQVVGKAFLHASFTAAIHSALVLYCFWRYHGCSSKALTHSTENNCVLGEVLGKEPPSSYSSWAFRCITLIISSFIKTHCTSTFLLSYQSVFSPHLHLHTFCPSASVPVLGSAAFLVSATPFWTLSLDYSSLTGRSFQELL